MKKKTYYHIILDQSGSMQDCIEPTISGFNEQLQVLCSLEERFEDQQVLVGLTRFNNEVLPTFYAQPPNQVHPLNKDLYRPGGMTALYDAIGTTILKLKDDIHQELAEDIATVVIVILTDGYENASKLFTHAGVSHLIKELEATGKWTFTYLGATLDAVSIAEGLNIKKQNSMAFQKVKIKESYQMISDSMEDYLMKRRTGENLSNFLKNKDS